MSGPVGRGANPDRRVRERDLPAELLRTGREEVRSYGGWIVAGEVTSASPAAPSPEGDPRFTITPHMNADLATADTDAALAAARLGDAAA